MKEPGEKEFFHHEFGIYLQKVSKDFPIGACNKCTQVRSRNDVNESYEICPQSILNNEDASPHDWQAFIDKDALEGFLKENVEGFKDLVKKAAEVYPQK